MSEVIVYEHPLSPYAQKVKLALMAKAVPFETRNLMQMSPAEQQSFIAFNPRGEVPVLVHNQTALFDSTIILEYIEDTWPEPALLPPSAPARARVRLLEEVMDTHFEANTWGLSELKHFGRASGPLADQLKHFGEKEIRQWYAWLDEQLADQPWFNGEHYGWGDLCVVPFVNGAVRFALTPAPDSNLQAWHQRVNALPDVITCRQAAAAAELDPDVMQAALAQGFKREYRDHRLEWMIRGGGIDVVSDGLAADNVRFVGAFETSASGESQ